MIDFKDTKAVRAQLHAIYGYAQARALMRTYNRFAADGVYALMLGRGTTHRSHEHLLLIQEAGIELENLGKPVVITQRGPKSFAIDERNALARDPPPRG